MVFSFINEKMGPQTHPHPAHKPSKKALCNTIMVENSDIESVNCIYYNK